MLTYETLRKTAQDEKKSQKLVKLPEDFFAQVRDYLEKKEAMSREKDSLWEVQSARRVLEDLLEVRESKIVKLAIYSVRSGLRPENMTPEENAFFKSVKEQINHFRKKRKGVMDGTEALVKEMVAITESLPEFVGLDMKTYGPYSEGDVVTLPREVVNLLLDKKNAEKIKPE